MSKLDRNPDPNLNLSSHLARRWECGKCGAACDSSPLEEEDEKHEQHTQDRIQTGFEEVEIHDLHDEVVTAAVPSFAASMSYQKQVAFQGMQVPSQSDPSESEEENYSYNNAHDVAMAGSLGQTLG